MSLKIVVLGNAGVGKTAVRNQFLHTNFTNQYKATIGVDFVTKQCTVERDGQEQQVQLQIWDTAGQERFQSIGTSFYRGCDACVFVYDITNQESLNALSNWMTQFLKFSGVSNPETFPFFIVGNKIDLEADRQVSHAQVLAMADLLKMQAIEASTNKLRHKESDISLPREPPQVYPSRFNRSRVFGKKSFLDDKSMVSARESVVSFYTAHSELDYDHQRRSTAHSDTTETQDFDMQVHREYSPDEIPFLETSAKSGEGIDLLFQFIAQNTPVPESDDGFTIHPVQVLETSRTSSCC